MTTKLWQELEAKQSEQVTGGGPASGIPGTAVGKGDGYNIIDLAEANGKLYAVSFDPTAKHYDLWQANVNPATGDLDGTWADIGDHVIAIAGFQGDLYMAVDLDNDGRSEGLYVIT